ncbi:hypothetical protein GOC83_03980 [Haloarcula rubripromontorii]|uniref:Uncharacterized protein n=1 Tax=Haloarcula rubripromontorii TaxID=1705562 RepID=A0A847U353_9EURY|nr:hypothetical protein [Haloarcula rubripromontorii]NLV05291.1 hypothetical protein [Haloarcula rubripromontorii]
MATPTSETNKAGKEVFDLDDFFIAPWGLATEVRPMHILWEGEIDRLHIIYDSQIKFNEAYNLNQDISNYMCETDESEQAKLLSIPSEELNTPGYINLKFSIDSIFQDNITEHPVKIGFELEDGDVIDYEDSTYTIRPRISVINEPEDIIITDETDEPISIDIGMRYVGFGLAQVDIAAKGEGELISKGESIYHDMIEALIDSGIHKKEDPDLEPVDDSWKSETGVEVPRETVEDLAEDMRELLSEESFDQFDSEELTQLADVLDDDQGDDREVVYQQLELVMLNSLLDMVDRHPAENVQLSNPNTKVEIEGRITEFVVEFHLSDREENDYETVEVAVEVDDQRSDGGMIEAEINTEWDHHQASPEEILNKL